MWADITCDGETGGLKIEGEDESYDFGSGAGFYVDATREPWSKGYKMYSYITEELPKALFAAFEQLDAGRVSITGHSMGGHGALTLVGLLFCLRRDLGCKFWKQGVGGVRLRLARENSRRSGERAYGDTW